MSGSVPEVIASSKENLGRSTRLRNCTAPYAGHSRGVSPDPVTVRSDL